MDFHNNAQPESQRMDQIVSHFFLKSLHVILDSRVPSFRAHSHSGELSSVSAVKRSDKWFHLILGDRPPALDNLNFWLRNVMDQMVIDIILVHKGSESSSANNAVVGASVESVIERWVVQYASLGTPANVSDPTYYKRTYKRLIILIRSIYSTVRLLPAHKIFEQMDSSSQTQDFDIIYKVSSFSDPFSRKEDELMKHYSFAPVEALPGRICVSVTYRSTLSDFNLIPLKSFPPKIITDYVGSPATDPLRAFPTSYGTSFPLRELQHPSAPFQRPHSWTSGLHGAAPFMHNQTFGASPSTSHTPSMPFDFPPPSPDIYGHTMQNYRLPAHQKSTSFDEYHLSPPFSSSPSPSPPYLLNCKPVQTRLSSGTAPVTIPMMGRSPISRSPNSSDPYRHNLPPLSPKSIKHDPVSQESPSRNRSFRKIEAARAGDVSPMMANHYSSLKVFRDSKEDSGRFSSLLSSSDSPRIGFSRTSSRLSFQDDLDDGDGEFTCPFDVDDVDTQDFQACPSLDGKKVLESSTSQPTNLARKSQDAAVGALVRLLRTAPPLRQDSSCYSSHSFKTELHGGGGAASELLSPRMAADALEELRSYREMKDLLLSKSESRVVSSEKL